MRFGHYPTRKDLIEGLDKHQALDVSEADAVNAVIWAVQEAERLLGKPLTRQKITRAGVILGEVPFRLDHFPVKDLKVLESSPSFFDKDESLGILYPNLPLLTYTISYEVGYEDGQVPASIQYLVQELAQHKVIPTFNQDHEQVVQDLITVSKRIWQEAEEKRNGIEASRAIFGKGFR